MNSNSYSGGICGEITGVILDSYNTGEIKNKGNGICYKSNNKIIKMFIILEKFLMAWQYHLMA